ncbi:MAG: MFS transporter [Chloroflexi bacterium]|nr:MFS transporter [Chloroflexota bacterium]
MNDAHSPLTAGALTIEEGPLATPGERTAVLWLTNFSHAMNHFQNHMLPVLYPAIMAELGFGYAQLGVLTAIRDLLGNGGQVIYGFLTAFFRRTHLLGFGSIILGIGTLLSSLSRSYTGFVGARAVAAAGSSAQNPVSASLLSGYFPHRRGTMLALNRSVAGVGSILAPLVAGLLLLVTGWRQIFFLASLGSLAMGLAYFSFWNRLGTGNVPSGGKKLAASKASYLRVLRNRNMIMVSLVMMVGVGGRSGSADVVYMGTHFVHDLGLSAALVGVAVAVQQFGGMVGPLGFGWLSDRLSRKGVLQASLFLSALVTLWLAFLEAYLPLLFLNMLIYGMVINSRVAITQALVADSLSDADRDAAFSMYYFIGFASAPVWALLSGFLMQALGFSVTFSVWAVSYLIGVALMLFVVDPRRPARP